MNKYLPLLFCIFSFSAYGQTKDVVVVLSRTNNMNVAFSDQIKREGGRYFVNGLEISKEKTPQARDLLQQFLTLSSNADSSSEKSWKACAAGTFVLKIGQSSRQRRIQGCAEGTDYGRWLSQLRSLKK